MHWICSFFSLDDSSAAAHLHTQLWPPGGQNYPQLKTTVLKHLLDNASSRKRFNEHPRWSLLSLLCTPVCIPVDKYSPDIYSLIHFPHGL